MIQKLRKDYGGELHAPTYTQFYSAVGGKQPYTKSDGSQGTRQDVWGITESFVAYNQTEADMVVARIIEVAADNGVVLAPCRLSRPVSVTC